jgi:hypothetical protein
MRFPETSAGVALIICTFVAGKSTVDSQQQCSMSFTALYIERLASYFFKRAGEHMIGRQTRDRYCAAVDRQMWTVDPVKR